MKKQRKKKKPQKSLLRFITLTAFTILTVFVLFFVLINAGWFGILPSESELKKIKHETATLVYSSDEVLLGKYFDENRTKIQWEDIPEHLVNALVATEDARFFSHEGIDGRSYLRVFFKTILMGDKSSGGGSTITQQLAKNLFGRNDYAVFSLPINKAKEIVVARRLEDVYSKNEILLFYLNTVPFGENVYGVEAAATRYFNKTTSQLTVPEAATLVGLLKANTYYNPRLHPGHALKRRNLVLNLMKRHGYISEKERKKYHSTPLQLDYSNYSLEGPANYFLYQVKQKARNILRKQQQKNGVEYDLEKDGLTIHTTLNAELQKLVKESAHEHLEKMQPQLDRQMEGKKNRYISSVKNDKKKKRVIYTWEGVKVREMTVSDSLWHYKKMLNAAAMIADPRDGRVKVWVGGNHFRYLPFDLIHAKRPAASVFKPILYSAALNEGYDACTYLSNEKKSYSEFDDWEPENYDRKSGGEVAMWYALAHSMNLPTIDLYSKMGHEPLDYTYQSLGFEGKLPRKPSVALGVKDVSLAELVRAYAAFANLGKLPHLRVIERILDQNGKVLYNAPQKKNEQAITTEQSEKITAMLSRAARKGTGAALYSRYGVRADLAAKTGTSQQYRDARFMCYNRDMVFGVWVGANDPQIHFNSGHFGSGAALALPVAGKTIKKMQRDSRLQRAYLRPMDLAVDTTIMMACNPKRTGGPVEGFINGIRDKIKNLFNGKDTTAQEDNTSPDGENRNKEGKIKKFFKKIFGSKEKKDEDEN